jgi:hypothetical protein
LVAVGLCVAKETSLTVRVTKKEARVAKTLFSIWELNPALGREKAIY